MKRKDIAIAIDRFDPRSRIVFRNRLHDERAAAILGASLGVAFTMCFATGLVSHIMQHPPSWYAWPARPAGFYRVTQGLHVATGLFSIPLLLAKLWVVYPKLFERPAITGVAHFLERISLLPLIGGGLFQLLTGVANINQWYFFSFFFTSTHYAMAWVTIGALVVHIGAKWHVTRAQLLTRHEHEKDVAAVPEQEHGLTRRGFLAGVFGAGGLITVFTVGQSYSALGRLALLSPRRPGVGPQHLPVNRSAAGAGVIDVAYSDDYRLSVEGNVVTPLSLTLSELQNMPHNTAELPIACVEGWSASAHWKGVRVRDILRQAGANTNSMVRVESLEVNGAYAQSLLNTHHAHDPDTLLALKLNGEPLHIDHGFPCRLIGPNRPGVLQTKWVHKLVVL